MFPQNPTLARLEVPPDPSQLSTQLNIRKTYCLTRLSSPPEKATLAEEPKHIASTAAGLAKLSESVVC